MDSVQYTNPKHFNAYIGSGTPSREKGNKAANPNDSANSENASEVISNARLLQLTQKLSQYTRGSDRRQVLRSLMDTQLMPR